GEPTAGEPGVAGTWSGFGISSVGEPEAGRVSYCVAETERVVHVAETVGVWADAASGADASAAPAPRATAAAVAVARHLVFLGINIRVFPFLCVGADRLVGG